MRKRNPSFMDSDDSSEWRRVADVPSTRSPMGRRRNVLSLSPLLALKISTQLKIVPNYGKLNAVD